MALPLTPKDPCPMLLSCGSPWIGEKYVKLPAQRAGLPGHAVASRMRAKEISFLIVPLDPAVKAGLAGHLPVNVLIDERGQESC